MCLVIVNRTPVIFIFIIICLLLLFAYIGGKGKWGIGFGNWGIMGLVVWVLGDWGMWVTVGVGDWEVGD